MKSVHAELALRLAGLTQGDRLLHVNGGREDLTRAADRVGACVSRAPWGPGHSLEFPDDAFDVAASWFVTTPDPEALREIVRVTKPAGRVVVMAYRSPSEIEQFVASALHAVVPKESFGLGRPHVLCRRLMGAGLQGVTYACADERVEFRNGQDLWDWVLTNSATPPVSRDQEAAVRYVLDGMLRERGHGVLAAPVNIGLGTK